MFVEELFFRRLSFEVDVEEGQSRLPSIIEVAFEIRKTASFLVQGSQGLVRESESWGVVLLGLFDAHIEESSRQLHSLKHQVELLLIRELNGPQFLWKIVRISEHEDTQLEKKEHEFAKGEFLPLVPS